MLMALIQPWRIALSAINTLVGSIVIFSVLLKMAQLVRLRTMLWMHLNEE